MTFLSTLVVRVQQLMEKSLLPSDADESKSTSFYRVKDLYKDLESIQSMPDVGDITLFMDVDFNNSSFSQNIVKIGMNR